MAEATTAAATDESLAKISDRIRKLLALAGSTNNPNEAANAATAAQKLMQEHKLSEVDVSEATSDGSVITEVAMGAQGFMASWKFTLISKVAQAFFCEAVGLRVGQRRKVRLVGKKNDIEVAIEVYAYLLKEIERLASKANPPTLTDFLAAIIGEEEDYNDILRGEFVDVENELHWKAKQNRMADSLDDDVRSYREKFRMGAAMGAAAQLHRQMKDFANSTEKALMVVNNSKQLVREHLQAKYGEHMRVEKTQSYRDQGAFADGYVAGSQIETLKKGAPKRLEEKS